MLLATDADWVVDDVVAALGGPTRRSRCAATAARWPQVVDATTPADSTSAMLDLQIGSMGGMAVTMALRLDESAGALPARPGADAARPRRRRLPARRSGADGWLVKPLDPLRLRRAVRTIAAGGTYTEHLTPTGAASPPEVDDVARDGVTEGDAPDDATPTVAEAGVS